MPQTSQGKLYLIPTTLSDAPLNTVLPDMNSRIIEHIGVFIVENIRTTRRFLKQVNRDIDIDTLTFFELNRHTPADIIATYLAPLFAGRDVGIISEAGCPAVADPGADVVALAQERGVEVVPLVGPSSILLALMGSGFNGQRFAFEGYLPIEQQARAQRLKTIEKRIYNEDQTQIFIETPYRNMTLVEAMLKALQPQTKLCIAADLTSSEALIKTKTIARWQKTELPDLHKRPCLFLIYK